MMTAGQQKMEGARTELIGTGPGLTLLRDAAPGLKDRYCLAAPQG
jgi:hypothetical protein